MIQNWNTEVQGESMQVRNEIGLESHRTRLLERLLLTRQRNFGDREILLSGLSTATSEVKTSQNVTPMNIGVLLKEARERIIHSEPNQNESLGIVFLKILGI